MFCTHRAGKCCCDCNARDRPTFPSRKKRVETSMLIIPVRNPLFSRERREQALPTIRDQLIHASGPHRASSVLGIRCSVFFIGFCILIAPTHMQRIQQMQKISTQWAPEPPAGKSLATAPFPSKPLSHNVWSY